MKLAKLVSAALVALASSSLGCTELSTPKRPNVILVSIDCLNQRQFEAAVDGGYGHALAALRNDAVTYTRAYAHAPWTTPSHMSMLTGLYPSQHGRDIPYGLMIRWNDFYARTPAFATLAERLGREGYATAAFVGQGSISSIYGLGRGFDVFEEHRKTKGLWTDLVATFDSAEAWLAERGERPFFLFFHTYDLHGQRPEGMSTDREAIQYIDQYLARLVVHLKSQGLYDSSLIILTGDHGSNMIEIGDKCCVHGAGHYEENIKVPLVVKLPDQTEAREESDLARHVDLLPTVLDVVGLSSESYDGPGLSLLDTEARAKGMQSFSEADGRCALRRALVTARHKYIYTPSDEIQALLRQDAQFFDDTCPRACRNLPIEELYDLQEDPFEKQNLLEGQLDEERAARLSWFRLEMAKHLNLEPFYSKTVVTEPSQSLDPAENQDLIESLRTLGYIQ